jgi:hypothetical protein
VHNRKALAWLMVGLLVLAGCSSTPRVVETQPNPNAVSPEIRAQIEATPEFQLIARLAAQEGKDPDWSRGSQINEQNGKTITQIPLGQGKTTQEIIVVALENDVVISTLLVSVSKSEDRSDVAIADLGREMTITGVVVGGAKQSVEQVTVGRLGASTSISSMLSPDLNYVSVQCSLSDPDIVTAIAALIVATAGLSACFVPFSPWCAWALAGYYLALDNYYRVMRAKGCIP